MSEFVALEFPPWVTWSVRGGAIVPKRPKGPNGKPLCGWCDTECTGRRYRWCSNECSAQYGRVWSWGALRHYIIQRDRETCQRCGTTDPPRQGHRWDPWDIDHIVQVSQGGTDHPDNLRLLCIACHVVVGHEQRNSPTAAYAAALKEEGQS